MHRITNLILVAIVMATAIQSNVCANENAYDTAIRSTALIVAGDSQGTGVLVDDELNLVVTNYHVIQGNREAKVLFPEFRDGRAIPEYDFYNDEHMIDATVVASNRERDLAILQIARIPDDIEAIKIGEQTRPGQSIHSIGNPTASDAMWIYTFGKVRQNYYRVGRYEFGSTQMQVLETDAPINPGDSGGPIVNDNGELVGVSQGFYTESRGYSYGVDISEITWYLNRYKRQLNEGVAETEPESSESIATDESDNAEVNLATVFASNKRAKK